MCEYQEFGEAHYVGEVEKLPSTVALGTDDSRELRMFATDGMSKPMASNQHSDARSADSRAPAKGSGQTLGLVGLIVMIGALVALAAHTLRSVADIQAGFQRADRVNKQSEKRLRMAFGKTTDKRLDAAVAEGVSQDRFKSLIGPAHRIAAGRPNSHTHVYTCWLSLKKYYLTFNDDHLVSYNCEEFDLSEPISFAKAN